MLTNIFLITNPYDIVHTSIHRNHHTHKESDATISEQVGRDASRSDGGDEAVFGGTTVSLSSTPTFSTTSVDSFTCRRYATPAAVCTLRPRSTGLLQFVTCHVPRSTTWPPWLAVIVMVLRARWFSVSDLEEWLVLQPSLRFTHRCMGECAHVCVVTIWWFSFQVRRLLPSCQVVLLPVLPRRN